MGLKALKRPVNHPSAFGGFGIKPRHLGIFPTKDRHQLLLTCTSLCKRGGSRIAQPMCRAILEPNDIAPFTHPIAKTIRGERGSRLGHEEGLLMRRAGFEGFGKLWGNRQAERGCAVAFLGDELKATVKQVGRSQLDQIRLPH